MVNSILIGKHIFGALKTNEDIKRKVGSRIYPLVAPYEAKTPFIVFYRTSVNPDWSKDCQAGDNVSMRFICVDTTYEGSCEVANALRKVLDNAKYNDEELHIAQSRMTNISEGWNDEQYVQTLDFNLYTTE